MSYKFDGSDDYLYPNFGSVAGALETTYQVPLTVAFWYKAPNIIGYQTLWSWGYATDDETSSIRGVTDTSTANDYGAGTRSSVGGNDWAIESETDATYDNTWLPLVFTFGGAGNTVTSRTVYVETYANSETNAASATLGGALGFLNIGRRHDGALYLGAANPNEHKIAEFAIWTKVLSQAEIESFLAGNAANNVNSADLVAYWPLQTGLTKSAGSDSVGSLVASGATLDNSDNPTITSTGKFVKVLAQSIAAGATGVEGVVLNAARDTVIGEFTSQAFSGTLEAGEAVLLIEATDISPGGSTLTTSDTPIVFAYNATDSLIGPASAAVIEV